MLKIFKTQNKIFLIKCKVLELEIFRQIRVVSNPTGFLRPKKPIGAFS